MRERLQGSRAPNTRGLWCRRSEDGSGHGGLRPCAVVCACRRFVQGRRLSALRKPEGRRRQLLRADAGTHESACAGSLVNEPMGPPSPVRHLVGRDGLRRRLHRQRRRDRVLLQGSATASATGAVPEPSTWAMGLLGFGGLGLMGWRKSRTNRLVVAI
jgi:hypothetical protein